jgi:hypothetical protein
MERKRIEMLKNSREWIEGEQFTYMKLLLRGMKWVLGAFKGEVYGIET